MKKQTKMLMFAGKYKGGGNVRENYRRYPMYEPEDEMYDEFESRRRRRDKRGRFMSEMDKEYEDDDRYCRDHRLFTFFKKEHLYPLLNAIKSGILASMARKRLQVQ